MLIGDDSPLRQLPSGLNIKQTLFLDAIRYCVEMADMSHCRLQQTLTELTSKFKSEKETTNIGTASLHALSDAWSIIDSVNRLRTLLNQMPYLKKKSPGLISFSKQTEVVEELRNIFQHLNHEIDNLIQNKSTAFGILNWVVPFDSSAKRCYICSLQPGTIFNRGFPLINPAGKCIAYPIDMITLIAGGKTVCLSDVMNHVSKLISSLENGLGKQIKELLQAGTDLLIILEWVEGEKTI